MCGFSTNQTEMDTRVANLAQTTLGAPIVRSASVSNEFSDYCEQLDSRLYELAERLISIVDDEGAEDESETDDSSLDSEKSKYFDNVSLDNEDAERILLSASYTLCMQEALRFLVQEEGLSQRNDMVVGLQRHLETQKTNAIERAVEKSHTKNVRPIRGPAF